MKYSNGNVLAGIVTYNPNIVRLNDNLTALCNQVCNILIVDNGSVNISEIEKLVLNVDCNIQIKKMNGNYGIARALKEIMDYSKEKNFKWVLSLDQDSVIKEGLVDKYITTSNMTECADIAMFTCLIKDRNFEDEKYEVQDVDLLEVPYCITSAAFTNVEKYFKTSGYDIDLFIDAVDFDICYSLRSVGYRICRINHVGLYHEVGCGDNRFFLGKKIVVYHQKPFRIRYYARNMILVHKKHKREYPVYKMIKSELALLIRIVLYEESKIEKINCFFKGVKEALLYEKNNCKE